MRESADNTHSITEAGKRTTTKERDNIQKVTAPELVMFSGHQTED